ncbi:amino acid ABC transporter substrate-binding protein (PAAT family) [Crenobacter luteus]|uniref:substrate-binding periplasmic protein n=1 Tax=Crenobacter luteus TaxID=1452487 RepID=UPI00104A9DFA|nr:transporter substrate-binding domain-containing protein [Crenobacter luteus]TCP10932.1 amino acid ABC transporter substrate-binding protein (PAAT family) [Crenobacter luteus]
MKRFTWGVVAAWAGVAAAAPAAPVEVSVGLFDGRLPPFVIGDGPTRRGVYPDLLDALSRQTGWRFVARYYPRHRLEALSQQGVLDARMGVAPAWFPPGTLGVYSAPFAESVDLLCFQPGTGRPVRRAEDLAGLAVGGVAGFRYPFLEAAFAAGTVRRDDSVSEAAMLERFAARRFPVMIVKRQALRRWRAESPAHRCDVGAEIGREPVTFRLHPSRAELLPELNRAIRALRQDGTLARIYARYQAD